MKHFTTLCGAAVVALLVTTGSLTAADSRDAAVQALKDNEAQWNRDFASKDVEKLVRHYADNAVLMAPGMPASSGKEAIRKVLSGMLGDPALSLKFQASRVEIAKSGDMAYTQGSYTMTMTDPSNPKQMIHDHGSYVTVYGKQADGSWKALTDIATSEVPPPAPAPKTKK